MHFRSLSDEETNHDFKIGNTTIGITPSYRYLGYDIHYTLNHDHSVNILSNAAGRALGALVAKYFTIQGLTYDTYTKVYDATVIPISDYAAGIWGTKTHRKFQTLQNRAMRTFLGVGKVTPVAFLYGEMAWLPPWIRHKTDVVRLWIRLLFMNDNRLTKKVFEWDYELAMNGIPAWNSGVKDILSSVGQIETFTSKTLH